MSIGEEQSDGHVIALAWSPPGLAMHKRSVLAVLTSNNILSLWTSESDSCVSTNWIRILIVNKFLSKSLRQSSKTRSLRPGSMRHIQSMAWSPSSNYDIKENTVLSGKSMDPFLLAVALEGMAIQIFVVLSPYIEQNIDWSLTNLFILTVQTPKNVIFMEGWFEQPDTPPESFLITCPATSQDTRSDTKNDRPSLLNTELQAAQIINSLMLGPTTVSGLGLTSVVSFGSSGTVVHAFFKFSVVAPHRPQLLSCQSDGPRLDLDEHRRVRVVLALPAKWQVLNVSGYRCHCLHDVLTLLSYSPTSLIWPLGIVALSVYVQFLAKECISIGVMRIDLGSLMKLRQVNTALLMTILLVSTLELPHKTKGCLLIACSTCILSTSKRPPRDYVGSQHSYVSR